MNDMIFFFLQPRWRFRLYDGIIYKSIVKINARVDIEFEKYFQFKRYICDKLLATSRI